MPGHGEYKCVTLPLSKLFPSPAGFRTALCTTCKSKDCTHPIALQNVSVAGVTQKMRVFKQGQQMGIVVQCEGYLP